MTTPIIAKPRITGYGDTFGSYGGRLLTDTITNGEIKTEELNTGLLEDGVEFNRFELSIRDYVLARLGHPVVRVELSPFQLKSSIEESINKFSYHAPFWNRQFAVFEASAGINQYLLPPHIAHNLTYVVYHKTLLTLQQATHDLEYDFFIKYFQDNFIYGDFRIGDFYLLQTHLELARKVLGQEGAFDLLNGNMLQIYPAPVINGEKVILEYRAIDTNTIHPAYRNWIQKYALAIAKGILGEIRGKYSSLPSPGGGANLNGAALSRASETEKKTLEEELRSEFEEPPTFTVW
jgi:hypothetical protein